MTLRDTGYATELARATLPIPDTAEDARIERLFIKALRQEEVRFSWWKDGRMMMRSLHLTEADLLLLLRTAAAGGVLTADVVAVLRDLPEPAA